MPSPTDSSRPTALLITRDLFFASKVTGTAAELGFRVIVEGSVSQAASSASPSSYRCLILDLSTPDLKVADVLAALSATNRPAVIAFGPHVETARLAEARDAGCDEVLPRSKFTATLPAILTRYLDPTASS